MASILNAIEQYEATSERGGILQTERAKALDYYLGQPFGNEVDGRSQVVSHDVADTIEWIKPSLIRIFTSGDELVKFDPTGPEDVEAAAQETDYVNYVIQAKNDWFSTAYVWFTDALLQKNGYVKAWWEEKTDTVGETYDGLTDDQMALVMQDPEVDLVAHESYQVAYGPQTMTLHRIRVKKKKTYGCVKFGNIPPERTRVFALHQSVDLCDSPFFEHWEWKTLSDLRAEGFEVPDDIGDMRMSPLNDQEENARNLYGENFEIDQEMADPASKRVQVRECWVRFDEDADGITELRHCIVVGHTILLDEEADFIPVAAITPTIMPHRHIGRSVADAIADLQLIKSTLIRGFLDNLYLQNNGRYGIDQDRVNLDDMLTSRPGGVVRTQGPPAEGIFPLVHPGNSAQVIQGLEYVDSVKENRTGVTKYNQGLDAQSLNKTAHGISQIMSASQSRVELIARVFAEGVKRLFTVVHGLTLKHATQSEVVRLRNKWVTVDPRSWKTRADMSISAGIGGVNKDEMIRQLFVLLQEQKGALPLGISTPDTIHHTLSKITQAIGYRDVDAFWVDPQGKPFQPPPDPKAMEAQLNARLDAAKLQQNGQISQAKLMLEAMLGKREHDLKAAEISQRDVAHQRDTHMRAQELGVDPETVAEEDAGDQQMMQMMQSMFQFMQNLSQTMEKQHGMMSDMMQHMTAPRKIEAIRGKNGKIEGAMSMPAGMKH